MTSETIEARARKAGIVPVLTIEDPAHAVPLAKALIAGGLDVLEVTLRTPAALDAIRAVADAGLDCVIGAGTILSADDAARARDAGSEFLVTPGTPARLWSALRSVGIPTLPGIATATEAMTALDEGFSLLKCFPAEQSGGAGFLKALSAPLPEARFMPTGGIRQDTMARYLCLPNVVAVGGSWLASGGDLVTGNFAAIEARARDSFSTAREARS